MGALTKTPRGAAWFPEIVDWLIDEIDEVPTRAWNPFLISEEDKKYYLEEVHPYFKDRCSLSRIQKQLPDDLKEKISVWSMDQRYFAGRAYWPYHRFGSAKVAKGDLLVQKKSSGTNGKGRCIRSAIP